MQDKVQEMHADLGVSGGGTPAASATLPPDQKEAGSPSSGGGDLLLLIELAVVSLCGILGLLVLVVAARQCQKCRGSGANCPAGLVSCCAQSPARGSLHSNQ
jgi:hypothetical protein